MWLTVFTVWECGTRSDGAERQTVRGRAREEKGHRGGGNGNKSKPRLRRRINIEEKC